MKTAFVIMSVAFFFGFTLVVNAEVEPEEPAGCTNTAAGEKQKIKTPIVAKLVQSGFIHFQFEGAEVFDGLISNGKLEAVKTTGIAFRALCGPDFAGHHIQKVWIQVFENDETLREERFVACKEAEPLASVEGGFIAFFKNIFWSSEHRTRIVIQVLKPNGESEFNGTFGAEKYNSAPKSFEFMPNPQSPAQKPATPKLPRPRSEKKLLASR